MSPVTQKTTVQQTTFRARKTAILEWEDPPTPEPVVEDLDFEIMVAFIESDECEGPVYLSVCSSATLQENLEDIYNQVGIEYNEFEYFVGDRKIDITKTFRENGIVSACEITPKPKIPEPLPQPKARGIKPILCEVEVFSIAQIEKSIKRDAIKFEHHIMIQGLKGIAQIEKSIKRDALKFEHHIMIQGLREVDEIAKARNLKADMLIIGLAFEALNKKREKLGLPRKQPQYAEPVWKKQRPNPSQ
jgi:hypothetical protein